MNKIQKNLSKTLERLNAMCLVNAQDAKAIAVELDDMLDNLGMQDFFGTEGATDPRGDQREGKFKILNYVQGVK